MTIGKRPLSLSVNGRAIGPIDVPDTLMMLDFLHEYLGLTGSRMGCGQGTLPQRAASAEVAPARRRTESGFR